MHCLNLGNRILNEECQKVSISRGNKRAEKLEKEMGKEEQAVKERGGHEYIYFGI
jgi:hypothetical protein